VSGMSGHPDAVLRSERPEFHGLEDAECRSSLARRRGGAHATSRRLPNP
jgi:hypothetical protein